MNPWEEQALQHLTIAAITQHPDPIDGSCALVVCALVVCDLLRPDAPIIYASDAFRSLTGYRPAEVLGRNCRFLQYPPPRPPACSPGGQSDDGGGGREGKSGGGTKLMSKRKDGNSEAVREMRRAVERNREVQVEVANSKKGGQEFVNLVSIIPVKLGGRRFNYSVGFLCEIGQ
ncbi:hypothetical protein VTK26DRAFT_1024 [Humicola hyalothermophila]